MTTLCKLWRRINSYREKHQHRLSHPQPFPSLSLVSFSLVSPFSVLYFNAFTNGTVSWRYRGDIGIMNFDGKAGEFGNTNCSYDYALQALTENELLPRKSSASFKLPTATVPAIVVGILLLGIAVLSVVFLLRRRGGRALINQSASSHPQVSLRVVFRRHY